MESKFYRGKPPGETEEPNKRSLGRFFLFLAGLLLLAGVFYGAVLVMEFFRWAKEPYSDEGAAERIVVIPAGKGASEVARILAGSGVVDSDRRFEILVRLKKAGRRLKAGEYRFDEPASPEEVLDVLTSARVMLHSFVVPEGYSLSRVSRLFEGLGFEGEEVRVALMKTGLITDLDPAADDLEGYLFPDTYMYPKGTSVADLVEMMVERFREVFLPEWEGREPGFPLNLRETVTLASLIEKETAVAEERSLISAVFHNRLRRNMLLECDPTVIYALKRDGFDVTILTRKDLDYDSPYNTYVYPGLPPGPIASPGGDSLKGAVRPESSDYLYFVAKGNGEHQFSKTYREHRRAVGRYRRLMREAGRR